MKNLVAIFYLLLAMECTHAQQSLLSSKSLGRGGDQLGTGTEAIFSNPAELLSLDNLEAEVNFQWLPILPTVRYISAGIGKSFGEWGASLGAQRFGDRNFYIQSLSVGIAQRIGNTSLGIRAKWMQMGIVDLGLRNSVGIDMGTSTQLGESIQILFLVRNINAPLISNRLLEYWPLVIFSGSRIKLTEQLNFYVELRKGDFYDTGWSTGLDFAANTYLTFRSGISGSPFQMNFGMSANFGERSITYGSWVNRKLGLSHAWSLGF